MSDIIKHNVTAIVSDGVTGKIRQKIDVSNMVVIVGLNKSIQQMLAQSQPNPFQYIALAGSKETTWAPTGWNVDEADTDLDGYEININRSNPTTYPNVFTTTGKGEVTYYNETSDDLWIIGGGIFNASGFETGDMLAAFKFPAPIHKYPGDTFKIIWSITVAPI